MYNDVHVQKKKHDNTRQYIEIFISNQIVTHVGKLGSVLLMISTQYDVNLF